MCVAGVVAADRLGPIGMANHGVARGPGSGRHHRDRSWAGGRQDNQRRQGLRRTPAQIVATAMPVARGQPLEPGTVAHAARAVVAAVVFIVVIAAAVVAVAVFAALFLISWQGANRTARGAGDTGMSAKECAIWPGTGGCRA